MSGWEAYRAVFWARWVVLALWLPGLVSPGFAQALSQTEFQRFTLPPDVIEADQFGASISLSGDRALVGRNNFELNSSPVHVYELDATETWVEVAQLNVPEADRFDEFGDDIDFGYPVALSGDIALVGAVCSGEAGDLAGLSL